jgi:thiol-disulfide isomerase/thioredoxin
MGMKKIYSLLILGCSSIIGFGQGKQNVTFSVDMNNYSASTFNVVNVNGIFNGWCGTCNALTDADKDGVWEGTFEITADSMEYKFTLDGWTGQETLAPGLSCTKTDGNFTNRFMYFNGKDTVLPTVCFESCGKCEKVTNKMESFSTENRVVYTDLSINAKVFVPVDKSPKTSPKLSFNAKEYFPK